MIVKCKLNFISGPNKMLLTYGRNKIKKRVNFSFSLRGSRHSLDLYAYIYLFSCYIFFLKLASSSCRPTMLLYNIIHEHLDRTHSLYATTKIISPNETINAPFLHPPFFFFFSWFFFTQNIYIEFENAFGSSLNCLCPNHNLIINNSKKRYFKISSSSNTCFRKFYFQDDDDTHTHFYRQMSWYLKPQMHLPWGLNLLWLIAENFNWRFNFFFFLLLLLIN